MAVRIDRVGDTQPLAACLVEVNRDVEPSEHQRPARLVVADEVGGVPEALEVDLLEEHLLGLLGPKEP